MVSPAVLALVAAWATAGIGRGSAPAQTPLDQIASAVAAVDIRDKAPLTGFMSFSASASPRPTDPPLIRAGAQSAVRAPALAQSEPEPEPAAPSTSIETAVQNSLAWVARRELRATEDKLARLVSASTAAAAAAEATRHARAQIARYSTARPAPAAPAARQATARQAPVPAPPVAPGVSACTARLQAVAARGRLRFPPGSTQLGTRARAFATVIGYMAARCPQAKITIEGVADPTGDPRTNSLIARTRAENTLAQVLRIVDDPARITLRSHVADPGDRRDGSHRIADDRRVEFLIEDIAAPRAPAD